MKKPESICIFGDSTAWGAWDMEKGGWINRMWLHTGNRDKDYVEIYNLSISGGTTDTILTRFENEAKIRNADALIFQSGGNDAAFKSTSDDCLVSPKKFQENLEEIISKAKAITENIVFMDLKNCDESKTTPVSWIDLHYTNENMQKYSKIMEGVCQQNNINFLKLGSLENEDFEDGLHPNASGHEKIFINVRDSLTNQGWI
jgi:lysophospholipase L1-like esterase